MESNFINELLKFTKSVDIISENDLNRILSALETFILGSLGANYYGIQTRTPVMDKEGLHFRWTNGKHNSAAIFKDDGDTYTGQTTWAYDQNVDVWITEETGKCLNDPEAKFTDQWNKREEIPDYWEYYDLAAPYTSIILCINNIKTGEKLGVFNMEFNKHLTISDNAKANLINLKKAILNLLDLYNSRKRQTDNTSNILDELSIAAGEEDLDIFQKPRCFIAFPNNRKLDVSSVLETISEKYSTEIEFIRWDNNHNSGSITDQMIKDIRSSSYGIAYFSEISEEDEWKFRDNSNVVYEAGMFNAMNKYLHSSKPFQWIPIREQNSIDDTPFDFQNENIVMIPRNSDNKLNRDTLIDQLSNRIEQWVR